MFKKLVSFVTGKVETAIEQNTSPEEAWRSGESTLKDTEKRYDTATANLQRLSGELKVLRGE